MKIIKESIKNVPDVKEMHGDVPFHLAQAKIESEETEKEIEKALEPNKKIVKDEPFTSGSDELKMKKPEAYKKLHLLENIFEDVEEVKETLTEAKDDDLPDDLWTKVYNSLCTEINPMERPEAFRKEKRGDRYEVISTDADDNIVVSGMTPEDFTLAKRVADYFGLKSKLTDYSHRTWSKDPYPYTFTIYVSEEE